MQVESFNKNYMFVCYKKQHDFKRSKELNRTHVINSRQPSKINETKRRTNLNAQLSFPLCTGVWMNKQAPVERWQKKIMAKKLYQDIINYSALIEYVAQFCKVYRISKRSCFTVIEVFVAIHILQMEAFSIVKQWSVETLWKHIFCYCWKYDILSLKGLVTSTFVSLMRRISSSKGSDSFSSFEMFETLLLAKINMLLVTKKTLPVLKIFSNQSLWLVFNSVKTFNMLWFFFQLRS